jgi:hypothetical protein
VASLRASTAIASAVSAAAITGPIHFQVSAKMTGLPTLTAANIADDPPGRGHRCFAS